jgi:type I restriction enzyme, R subunit
MLSISETATRAKLIDLLTAAGWNLEDGTQVDFEIPVDGYDKEPWNGEF